MARDHINLFTVDGHRHLDLRDHDSYSI